MEPGVVDRPTETKESRSSTDAPEPPASGLARLPAWVLGLIPLAIIAGAVALFALVGVPGLGERTGPPVEELAVERTVLEPDRIELTVRNDGPDAVTIQQVVVNDAFTNFQGAGEVDPVGARTLTIDYPWIEGEAYAVKILTSTGGTVEHEIAVAVPTPEPDADFFALMALLGLYVGVIPVTLGMLWLPFVRRVSSAWTRALMGFTVGLLGFLVIDTVIEGLELTETGPQAFGGIELVPLGAIGAYLALAGVDAWLRRRRGARREAGAGATQLALLVALGIGLHNLGEGLAIGSSYATGALALGAFLVIGFAIHNTTEGLAIVAPLAGGRGRPKLVVLLGFGLLAGAPAILGAVLGATAVNPSVSALLLGVGAGAIVQVIVQIAPALKDDTGRTLTPLTAAGIAAGVLALYLTGLLIAG